MAKKTIEQLQEEHSEMLATAGDLGMDVSDDLKIDFDTAEVGATVVKSLDSLIRKFRAGLDGAGGDENSLATNSEQEQDVPAKSKSKKPKAKTAPKPVEAAAAEEEPPVAKTAKKSTAKKAVKKNAKKNAKKTAKKSAAKKEPSESRGFDPDAKISWGTKPNPAREDSGRHGRIEAVRKANGKTVKTYLAAKGNPTTLKNCVKAGLCRVA